MCTSTPNSLLNTLSFIIGHCGVGEVVRTIWPQCVQRPEDSFVESVLNYRCVGSGDQTQVINLVASVLSHLLAWENGILQKDAGLGCVGYSVVLEIKSKVLLGRSPTTGPPQAQIIQITIKVPLPPPTRPTSVSVSVFVPLTPLLFLFVKVLCGLGWS